MRNVYFAIMFFALSLIGTAYAATDTVQVSDVFKINQQVNYAKPCFNNGTYCSASATCNYTITGPNNLLLVNNKKATNQISVYNYSITPRDIGIYKVDMTCIDTL